MTEQNARLGQIGALLLGPDDQLPVLRKNPMGASDWLLLCDHAGNAVPRALGDLGIDRADLDDHIGIDIGAWALTTLLADALDAEAIGQSYSRLVIDNNRQPGSETSIPTLSDRRPIPANVKLSASDARARIDEIFLPYHRLIEERIASRRRPVLCAVHSFTRQLGNQRRTVDIGVIHGTNPAIADSLIATLKARSPLVSRRNEPYQIDFVGDYTLPVHAQAGGLPYVELEICQDLIATEAGQHRIANLLAPALRIALQDRRL